MLKYFIDFFFLHFLVFTTELKIFACLYTIFIIVRVTYLFFLHFAFVLRKWGNYTCILAFHISLCSSPSFITVFSLITFILYVYTCFFIGLYLFYLYYTRLAYFHADYCHSRFLNMPASKLILIKKKKKFTVK